MKNIQSQSEWIAATPGTTHQRIKTSRRAWLACVGWFGFSFARAGVPWPDALKTPAVKAAPLTHYLISAILREGVDGFSIKLVHSRQSAGSADEATGIFTRRVLQQFPGYALAKTIITEISLPPESCGKGKQDQPAVTATAIYAVSAVMHKGIDGFDILLLNGWVLGNRADEALNSVLHTATATYPHYAPIETLVTELDVARPLCSTPSPVRGQWKEV